MSRAFRDRSGIDAFLAAMARIRAKHRAIAAARVIDVTRLDSTARQVLPPGPPTVCPYCHYPHAGKVTVCVMCERAIDQPALPEPTRTSLLIVLSFAAGVIFYGYAVEQRNDGLACFPDTYQRVAHDEAPR